MKPVYKSFLYLIILTVLDFSLRKGALPLPLPLPKQLSLFLLFFLFAVIALFLTKKFSNSDNLSLTDLGISLAQNNRTDFLKGLGVGIFLWGLVAISQSFTASFSWVFRPEINGYQIAYGLLFVFVADVGTELYYRGYALTQFKNHWGAIAAITFMVLFSGFRSFSFEAEGELLFYMMIIPALHTIFFSLIYFKTKRMGAAIGIHTGANFITNSIFDLRPTQANAAIPEGMLEPTIDITTVSLTSLHGPYVLMAILFSLAIYFWFKPSEI